MDYEDLYISLLLPPSNYASGVTVFKRIIDNKRPVDVFQLKTDLSNEDFDNFKEYINERIFLELDCKLDSPSCIINSLDKAIDLIKKDYKNIYSRSWFMNNHFIALEYKFLNPNVFWTAEFSDPLILNMSNKVRRNKKLNMNNPEYVNKVNKHINELNEKNNASFQLIENHESIYFMTEYLTYLFADKIIFTNVNQRKMMLNQFPEELQDFVFKKSEIKRHPTLDEEFYHIAPFDLELNEDYINIAYFGRDYYGQRHFESLFYSIESLNHKFKDKIRIYLFIDEDKLIKKLISPLKSAENFIVKKPLDYFEFLNATTQFDVLVVNDVITKGIWPLNPYLPSKLSDYLGSSRDIWALYESQSILSELDLKYKSDISDFKSCRNQLIRILEDYGFRDENYSVDEDYFMQRLTTLNTLYGAEFKRNSRLQKENKSLKNTNKDILSSNSWKLTKPLRNLRNKK